MKFQKILFALAIFSMVMVGCKDKPKKKGEHKAEKTEKAANPNTEKLALNISGMSCEIGCAKMIESKLSKQDGVIDAKVVYNDSLAKIKFDNTKTNKASLMTFVEGLANNSYKVTEAAPTCSKKAKKECDASKKACDKTKKECDKSAKAACDKSKKECDTAKKACDKDKTSACSGKNSKACSTACAEACETSKETCAASCEMQCCA